MRTILLTLVLTATLVGGCQLTAEPEPVLEDPGPVATGIGSDGLTVILQVPQTALRPGQTLSCRVIVMNDSNKAITITPAPGWPVHVQVWQRRGVGWESVRTYPESAMRTCEPYTLQPGNSRQFDLDLRVEPDWPMHDRLALVADVSGRPDLQARRIVTVVSAE